MGARYIGLREQIDKKAVAKREERLHFLNADRPNKHTLFLDEDDIAQVGGSSSSGSRSGKAKKKSLKNFDLAAHLDTHPDLLESKTNRPRLKQLDSFSYSDSVELDAASKE